ncbi:MAG: hypothetical protein ACM3S4_10465 [Burkholderiales bacterium]
MWLVTIHALASSKIVYQLALFGMRTFQISDINNQYSDKEYVFSRWITCIIGIVFGVLFCLLSANSAQQKLYIFIYMIFRLSEAGMDVLHGVMQSSSRMDVAGKSLIIRGIIDTSIFVIALLISKQLLEPLIIMALFSLLWTFFYEYPYVKSINKVNKG